MVSTHLKNMLVKLEIISPIFGVKIKNGLSCHHLGSQNHDVLKPLTPWKFNIAPENGWLEDEFPFGIPYFQGLC